MASTRQPVLHDNLLGGVETSVPAHLLQVNQWTKCHNMRFDPALLQVPKKKVYRNYSPGTVLWLGNVPNFVPGFGNILFLTETGLFTLSGTQINTTPYTFDSSYRRWSVDLYNNQLYFINELNAVRRSDGGVESAIENAPKGRYVVVWYDHIFVGFPTFKGVTYPNRCMWSDLYKFSVWDPEPTNEADHYDFVEWQKAEYPFVGVSGMAKLGRALWVYTPTAIVPLVYVGKPKVCVVQDDSIVTGAGNTYPWTLVAMNNVHFFYDAIEKNFFAFDGRQPIPIGGPVRQYVKDTINPNPVLAAMMWGSVDVENTEIIWRFVSNAQITGRFDKLVRFNYRQKVWSTGSDENVHSFCGSVFGVTVMGELEGVMGDLPGIMGLLGTGDPTPRLYGTSIDFVELDVTAVTAFDGLSVSLSWPEPGFLFDEDGYYEILRNGEPLIIIPVGTNSYIDFGITYGETYVYQIHFHHGESCPVPPENLFGILDTTDKSIMDVTDSAILEAP